MNFEKWINKKGFSTIMKGDIYHPTIMIGGRYLDTIHKEIYKVMNFWIENKNDVIWKRIYC